MGSLHASLALGLLITRVVQTVPPSHSFSEFIRSRKEELLNTWASQVRAMPPARELPPSQLLDELPDLLDGIAKLSDKLACGDTAEPALQASGHARSRLVVGFELGQVIAEFRLLRECILMLWERDQARRVPLENSTRPLNSAIDWAVGDSVTQYVTLRSRVTAALDHVSGVALTSSSLNDFLIALLRVFKDEMPAVQTCAILLREGERLRARAAIGLEEELAGQGFSLRIGEGFAGRIARSEQPLLLRDASRDPLVSNPVIRDKGVKALYGVPLLHVTKGVIGVAHMGSLTAYGFGAEDMQLFRSMAARAALAIEYHAAKETAEQAVRVRDGILSIVSHDLRNMLGVVLTTSQVIERQLSEPSKRLSNALATIRRSARSMTRLVEDLLDYGSLESGQLRLRITRESPAQIVNDIVEAHTAAAAENGIRVAQRIDEMLSPVDCDRERILQVFGNLIGNALKFSPAGTKVVVGAEAADNGVRFSVSDEGPGIEAEHVEHIFDRYWRPPGESKRGRGLGLAIVKGIVEAHAGVVGVTSSPGKGSTFHFWLPASAHDGADPDDQNQS